MILINIVESHLDVADNYEQQRHSSVLVVVELGWMLSIYKKLTASDEVRPMPPLCFPFIDINIRIYTNSVDY